MNRLSPLLLLIPAVLAAQVSPIFPGRAVTNADVFIRADTCRPYLAQQIGTTELTFSVTTATGCPTSNFLILVESELIAVSSVSGPVFTIQSLGRGYAGTTAAGHRSGVPIFAGEYAYHHNRLAAEVESIEAFLVAGGGGGGGGSPSFSAIQGGSNVSAAMVCGTGCSMNFTGSGTINASSVLGLNPFNASNISSGTLGNNFLTASGVITINTTAPLTGGGGVAPGGNLTLAAPTASGVAIGLGNVAGTANQIAVSYSGGTATVSIPTNPTLPGTTTGTFSGNISGNATTATALATNPALCPVGTFPRGINASGTPQSCSNGLTFTNNGTGAVTILTPDRLSAVGYAMDFCAVANVDGTTDNTTCLQNALNALGTDFADLEITPPSITGDTTKNFVCTSLSWGSSANARVHVHKGATLTCSLPVPDSTHIVVDDNVVPINPFPSGFLSITSAPRTTDSPHLLSVISAADTGLFNNATYNDILWDLSATRQFLGGGSSFALTSINIKAATWTAAAAQTISADSTMAITSPPICGTNLTCGSTKGLWIEGTNVNSGAAAVTASLGLQVDASTGASNNGAAYLNGNVSIGPTAGQPPTAETLLVYNGSGSGNTQTLMKASSTQAGTTPVLVIQDNSAANNFVAYPTGALTLASSLTAKQIYGSSAAPSIACNPGGATGAGTGPTCNAPNGTDLSGTITITTGSAPGTSSNIATITFSAVHASAPGACIVQPLYSGVAAAALPIVSALNASGFTIQSGSTALAATTTLAWLYLCI